MKLPKIFKQKEQLERGDLVTMIHGYGYRSGIVLISGKRKSRVRFVDGVEMFVVNRRLNIVDDFRLKNQILRDLKLA